MTRYILEHIAARMRDGPNQRRVNKGKVSIIIETEQPRSQYGLKKLSKVALWFEDFQEITPQ